MSVIWRWLRGGRQRRLADKLAATGFLGLAAVLILTGFLWVYASLTRHGGWSPGLGSQAVAVTVPTDFNPSEIRALLSKDPRQQASKDPVVLTVVIQKLNATERRLTALFYLRIPQGMRPRFWDASTGQQVVDFPEFTDSEVKEPYRTANPGIGNYSRDGQARAGVPWLVSDRPEPAAASRSMNTS